jgi:cytochrome c biogenesis protein CcdA
VDEDRLSDGVNGLTRALSVATPCTSVEASVPRMWQPRIALVSGSARVGVVISLLAVPFGDILRWSIPISAVVLVALGIALLAGRNPFSRLAGVQVPVVRNPLGQAYAYGLLVGPVALPCAGPFLVALLAISIGLADGLTRVGSFVVYGFGFGLPLVALAAIGATRGQAISRLVTRHHVAISRVAGALLIATAAYELYWSTR